MHEYMSYDRLLWALAQWITLIQNLQIGRIMFGSWLQSPPDSQKITEYIKNRVHYRFDGDGLSLFFEVSNLGIEESLRNL